MVLIWHQTFERLLSVKSNVGLAYYTIVFLFTARQMSMKITVLENLAYRHSHLIYNIPVIYCLELLRGAFIICQEPES